MVKWEAQTAFSEIKVRTVLFVYEARQIAGQPERRLLGDHTLWVQTANQRWLECEIKNATREAATLVLPSGSQFIITPSRPDELGSTFSMPGMHTQDWVVRSVVEPDPKIAA